MRLFFEETSSIVFVYCKFTVVFIIIYLVSHRWRERSTTLYVHRYVHEVR